MLNIKTWRDPYEGGFSPTRPKEITINEGLTVLVGCNGAGKTTLIMNIQEQCRKDKIPCLHYNNLSEGGSRAFGASLANGNFGLAAGLYDASEGEAIKINFGGVASKIRQFLKTGFYDTLGNRLFSVFSKEDKDQIEDKRRVLLFDAIDSGLSVDSVAEIRDVMDLIMEDAKKMDVEVYIIISANEYELVRKAPCFDVAAGKHVELPDYEAYRDFIIKSRERKDKRNKAAQKVMEKRQTKKGKL